MHPDTYFIIKLWVGPELKILGPYCDIQYATLVLVDHLPDIANCLAKTPAYNYKAEVHECLMQEKGIIWNTISIPVTENKCRRKKLTAD